MGVSKTCSGLSTCTFNYAKSNSALTSAASQRPANRDLSNDPFQQSLASLKSASSAEDGRRVLSNLTPNYGTSACWDIDGHYCLPVFTGLWTVQIYDAFLNDFGLQSLPRRDVNVPITGQAPPVDFVLSPMAGDFRAAHLTKPLILPNGALQLELNGQAALSWRVERSSNLIDWTPIASKYSAHGSFIIEDPTGASNSPTFYRAVWIN